MLSLAWVLDPGNSRHLLDRLRPHALHRDFEIIWCGEGWRKLVEACHDELVASFPDYRFVDIEQAQGVLSFQARPRNEDATAEELALLQQITDKYGTASASICEWCGQPGSYRKGLLVASQRMDLTLCDACAEDLRFSPYPRRPAPK